MKKQSYINIITLFVGLFTIMIVFTLVDNVKSTIYERDSLKERETVEAVISRIDEEYISSGGTDGKGRYLHTPYLTYTVRGIEYKDVMSKTYIGTMKQGDTIKIYYNSDNPTDFIIENEGAYSVFGLIFMVIAFLPFIFIAFIYIKNIRKHNALAKNGIIKIAIVKSYKTNKPTKKRRYSTYNLICEYSDERSGKTYTYISKLTKRDAWIFIDKEVEVYVMPEDNNIYEVNLESLNKYLS